MFSETSFITLLLLQLFTIWNTALYIVPFFLFFPPQDNAEAIHPVEPGASQVDRSLNEDANTKEVEVLTGCINGQETAQAVNNSTVVKTEKEVNTEFQHQNYFTNVDDTLIKNEMEKNILQEHALHQNGVDINIKCEVKDEIKIEEHEICVEDTQDVR
jgi:hypothetical protein